MKPQHLLNSNDQQQHLCGGVYGIEHQEMVRNTFKSDNSDSPAESPTMPHSDLNGPNRLYTNIKYNNNPSGTIPVSSPNRNLSPSSYAKLRCSEQLASPPDSMVMNQDENVVYSPNYYASSPATTSRDFGSARQTPEPQHSMAGEPKFATFRSIHDQKQLFYHPDAKDFHRAANETNPHPHFVNAFENNFERFQRESQRQSKQITTNDNNNRINLIYGAEPFDYFVPNDYENNEKKLQNIQHQYAMHQHHLVQQGHFRMRKDNQQTSTTTTTTTINNDSNNNTNSNDRSLAYEPPDSDETDSHEFDRKKTSLNASEFNCGNNNDTNIKHLIPIKCKSEAINEFNSMQNLNKIHLHHEQMKPRLQVLHDKNLPGSMNDVNFSKLNNEHNEIPADECEDNNESHVNL